MKLSWRLDVLSYNPAATHQPSLGQETDSTLEDELASALLGSGAAMAFHVPWDSTSRRPWPVVVPVYWPPATHEVAPEHDSLLKNTSGLVAGGSGRVGKGACIGAQPEAGGKADAGPLAVAKSPPSAPVPIASTPSAATTAVRRSFDGVTRPEPLRRLPACETLWDISHTSGIRQESTAI
jgi:hypothetical protein